MKKPAESMAGTTDTLSVVFSGAPNDMAAPPLPLPLLPEEQPAATAATAAAAHAARNHLPINAPPLISARSLLRVPRQLKSVSMGEEPIRRNWDYPTIPGSG